MKSAKVAIAAPGYSGPRIRISYIDTLHCPAKPMRMSSGGGATRVRVSMVRVRVRVRVIPSIVVVLGLGFRVRVRVSVRFTFLPVPRINVGSTNTLAGRPPHGQPCK